MRRRELRGAQAFAWSPCLGLLVLLRGPEREVVAEQLHDEGRVLVALLVEGVQLGDGVVEGLVG